MKTVTGLRGYQEANSKTIGAAGIQRVKTCS